MRYNVTGRVHPERANVCFQPVQGHFANGTTFVASCDASQLHVMVDSPAIIDPATAKIAAEDLAHIVVASLGYALGSSYAVEAIQVIDADSKSSVFGVRYEPARFADEQGIFNAAFELAFRNLFFRLAIRDYVRALGDVQDCATYCYRAIEAIKSAFTRGADDDGWLAMHAALGTSRDDIENIVKQYADPVRHGNWANAPQISGAQRGQMVLTTRDILKRYLDHAATARIGPS